MRIISANLNGIRSAASKGFFTWLASQNADVVALQELKAQSDSPFGGHAHPHGLQGWFHYAEKKAIAVLVFTADESPIVGSLKDWALPTSMQKDVISKPAWQSFRCIGLSAFRPVRKNASKKFSWRRISGHTWPRLLRPGGDVVLLPDWNIAHREVDLKNWKGNLKKFSGFLPEERGAGKVFDELGFVDVWRALYPEIPGYTWWSNRGAKPTPRT